MPIPSPTGQQLAEVSAQAEPASPGLPPDTDNIEPSRSHRLPAERVEPAEPPQGDTVVRMAWLDDRDTEEVDQLPKELQDRIGGGVPISRALRTPAPSSPSRGPTAPCSPARNSPGATADPMQYALRYWPACSPSMSNAKPKRGRREHMDTPFTAHHTAR